MTLLLNYAHPLTPEQAAQVAALLGEAPAVRDLAVQVDRARPLAEVARELADTAGLRPEEWQTAALVLNPPALAPLALALIAELHGRCGGFPAIINVRPVAGSLPTRYEVAEILNLQALRDAGRTRRAPEV
ncbi:MAG TPA: CRISPR-associated protein Csx15 [Roseiflexaceae bacterium]|nr:CRISPR-associated protein Csx15 [Roseiflexaceae bacterium]